MVVDPGATEAFNDEGVVAGAENATDDGGFSDNRPTRALSAAEEEAVLVEGA